MKKLHHVSLVQSRKMTRKEREFGQASGLGRRSGGLNLKQTPSIGRNQPGLFRVADNRETAALDFCYLVFSSANLHPLTAGHELKLIQSLEQVGFMFLDSEPLVYRQRFLIAFNRLICFSKLSISEADVQ